MRKITVEDSETQSNDIVAENIAHLKACFPEAFTEGKIDFEVLTQLLGGTVDEREEKYGLNWHGKRQARQLALTPSTGTLRPCPEDSVDWDTTRNLMIEGDNLEVLKLLQKSYTGKVKLIYIDPPYNTGKDFIYKDDFTDNIRNYKETTGQVDGSGLNLSSNPETGGRYHTDWLNMIYPRLKLARNLLKNDGVIFISIDENELMNLSQVCNEAFGEENHIATMAIVNNMKGRNDKANIATCHEYLIIYTKGGFVSLGLPLTPEQLTEYKYVDEDGNKYALRDLRKRGRPDRRQDRPNMYYPVFYNQKQDTCSLTRMSVEDIEILPKRGDGSDGRWRWGKNKTSKNISYLRPRFNKNKNRWDIDHRVYLRLDILDDTEDEETDDGDERYTRTSKSKSFWWGGDISTDVANREFKGLFSGLNPDYPKSPFLIEKLLHMSIEPEDIVVDFFAGYSTTGDAVYRFNLDQGSSCKFILVQLPEQFYQDKREHKESYSFCQSNGLATNVAEISKERIRRAAAKIKEEHPDYHGDLGFRVFKLDTSNIRSWEPDRDDLEGSLLQNVEHIKSDRSEDDILYELLLKLGLDLCVPIETRTIAGKSVHSVGAGTLIACLDEKIDENDIETLAHGIVEWHEEMKPAGETTVVFRDSAFADDVAKTNLTAILEQRGLGNVRSL